MRRGNARRVVHPVPHHRHALAHRPKFAHHRQFLFRTEFPTDIVQTQRLFQMRRSRGTVSGENQRPQTQLPKPVDQRWRLRPDRVPKNNSPKERAAPEPHLGDAIEGLGKTRRASGPLEHPMSPAQKHLPAPDLCPHSTARHGFHAFCRRGFHSRFEAVPGHGARQGMGGFLLQSASQAEHLGLAARRIGADFLHAQLARGQGPCLVHGHNTDLAQFFHCGTAPEQDAAPGSRSDCRKHSGRDGENEGARGSDHKQGHGMVKRAGFAGSRPEGGMAKSQPPEQKHSTCQSEDDPRVAGAKPVSEPLGRRLHALGGLDQAHHLLQSALLSPPLHTHFHRPPLVQGPGIHRVPHPFGHRRGFPGQVGLVR